MAEKKKEQEKAKVVVLPMSQMKKKRTFINAKTNQIINETEDGTKPVVR